MEFVSEGCLDLTGYQPSDILYNQKVSFSKLILPEYQEYIWNEVQAALQENRQFVLEYKIKSADGKEKWVAERGCPVTSEGDEDMVLEGFITDITERKNAQEKLRKLKNAFKYLQKVKKYLNFFEYSYDLR
jgi:PAS domain S-box-containing protein